MPLSESFKDMVAIAPVHIQPRSKLSMSPSISSGSLQQQLGTRRSTAQDLLKSKFTFRGQQESENDPAEIVIVCEPEGTSLQMGGLHPRASLYEKPVNLDEAKRAHAEFRRVMREKGVRVLTVREILAYGAEDHVGARMELEDLAMGALTYAPAGDSATLEALSEEQKHYFSDAYKRHVIERMSVPQLIDAVMMNPTVHLTPTDRDTGLRSTYTIEPLSNLVYTRDQQITTAKGVVMGRLRSPQRGLEVALMRFCFGKLGIPVEGEVVAPGYLEGGDFVPVNRDLSMLGIGLRSNIEAAQQLMDKDLLGTRRFAVVRDDFERHQDRMHLDCVFAVISDRCCIMLEEMMGDESATKRVVDEYTKQSDGSYALSRADVELSRYMRDNGFEIIPIEAEHQLLYACNVLNLGNERIISVHLETARSIVASPHFHGDVQYIDYSPITSMYGAVHCSSQVIKRTAKRGM